MSKLKVADDDHAEAAGKHRADAEVLIDARRHDGAGYLSGYVLECAIKSVILHDKSFDPTTARHDTTTLAHQHKTLSQKPFGHNLVALLHMTVTASGAPYMPDVPPTAAVLRWKETTRYAPSGTVTEAQARSYYEWACTVYEQTVLKMKLDGVI